MLDFRLTKLQNYLQIFSLAEKDNLVKECKYPV